MDWGEPQSFFFAGLPMVLDVDFSRGGTTIRLQAGAETLLLSQGLGGDNICPAFHIRNDRLLISWVNYLDRHAAIGIWSWQGRTRQVYAMPGLKFVSPPRLLYRGDEPAGMVFLGNERGNDDLFHYDFADATLQNITNTPYSEKEFSVEEHAGYWEAATISLHHAARYRLQRGVVPTMIASRRVEVAKTGRARKSRATVSCAALNTFIAFGDSITEGDMRMNNLPQDQDVFPYLAYPAVLENKLLPTYGQATAVNKGHFGEDTFAGVLRVGSVLQGTAAGYFLVLFGTNDCQETSFSVDSALENLEYIIDQALLDHLHVIVSTVPPRNDHYGYLNYVLQRISDFNTGVSSLVARKKADGDSIAMIDTHQAFMDYLPPVGWKKLLEDRGSDLVLDAGLGGQHPSPLGHQVMAGLFYDQFIAFVPQGPSSFTLTMNAMLEKQVVWPGNCESDFDHYLVEFGYVSGKLNWQAESKVNGFSFLLPPFLDDVYFRLSAVDKFGNQSAASSQFHLGTGK